MNWRRTTRAELRKLTSTKMPWTFLIVLATIGVATAIAVAFGTDMDGSKTFISTAADQQSLMAFASNALVIAGLFGAIAIAREYGHGTVVHTFLTTPHRSRAVLAQLAAACVAGGVLGLVGGAISAGSIAVGLTATEFGFMVPAADLAQVLAASTFAGAAGAGIGAGIGAFIRNTGGAVVGTILLLMILPPLAVQMVSEAMSWVPGTLANVASGVSEATSIGAAIIAIGIWALVPAVIGITAVTRRDVV
jgi:ABC-type transport system involved in multi-copper enzyme maturation permease subunit